MPATQLAVPLDATHTCPHVPQFAGLLAVLVSQPSAARVLQSAKPAAHDAIMHAPITHDDVVCVDEQAVEQLEQWFTSALVSVSQPFAAMPSQSPKPVSHRKPHVPVSHVGIVCGGEAQGVHDGPQAVVSWSPTQSLPHAWKPALHASPQCPALQVPWPFDGSGHTVEHVPQCCVSVWTSTHDRPQRVDVAPLQPLAQWVPLVSVVHIGIGSAHVTPHAPQCAGCERSLSQPVPGSALQWAKP